RTPKAIAGIRGTIVIVEVDRVSAQAGSSSDTAYTTRFTVITGEVQVRQLRGGQPFGAGVTLGKNDQARFTGPTAPVTRSLTPAEASALSNSFKAAKSEPPAAASASMGTQSHGLAIQLIEDGHPRPAPSA